RQRQQYRVTTTGREHGDDGIEQAGAGTSPAQLAAVAPPPPEAICQQVSSADYGQRRSKRQPHRRRKHRVSVANETRGDVVSWSRYRPWSFASTTRIAVLPSHEDNYPVATR
ncbi:hypothetical protein PF002_g28274, partial [Phytophthora fragariae]